MDVYPIPVDVSALIENNFEPIRAKLLAASPQQLLAFYKEYSEKLSSKTKSKIGSCYLKILLDNDNSVKVDSFGCLLKAVEKAKKDSFVLDELPSSRIAFVEATSPTLKKQRSIEFPVAIEKNMPFKVEKCSLSKSFDLPIAKTADILVVLNITAARTDRKISKQERVLSEYKTATKSVANPAYSVAQANVDMARMQLSEAQVNAAAPSGGGLLGLALVIAKIAAKNKAEENYQLALQELTSTSSTIEEPVYSKYKFTKATIDVKKEATVTYYIIDRKSNKYMKNTFDAQQKQTFLVNYGLQENDKERWSHLRDCQTEEDVDKFDKSSISINLSDVLATYLNKKSQQHKLSSFQQIKKDILKDKNAVLAENQKTQFTATPKNDARFNSVVVVYHPGGGSGTGFYIADDLILTNYHVIEGAKYLDIKLYSGQETFGKVYAKDIRLDLALVKVQARGVPVSFYKNRDLPIGEQAEAIGHPKGLEYSITRGITSAVRNIPSRYMKGGKKISFIQTDVAVNPGNSGGPLFVGDKVIGVVTQKLAATEIEGLSFAIHYGEVQKFLKANEITMR